MHHRNLAVTSLAISLIGCSTIPYGVFDGQRVSRVDPDIYDLFVLSVDGQLDADARKTRMLKPGFHLLNVVTSKPGRRGELTYQPLPLTVAPCTRYLFVAKHDDRLGNQRWEPVLAGTNEIPGCNPNSASSK